MYTTITGSPDNISLYRTTLDITPHYNIIIMESLTLQGRQALTKVKEITDSMSLQIKTLTETNEYLDSELSSDTKVLRIDNKRNQTAIALLRQEVISRDFRIKELDRISSSSYNLRILAATSTLAATGASVISSNPIFIGTTTLSTVVLTGLMLSKSKE